MSMETSHSQRRDARFIETRGRPSPEILRAAAVKLSPFAWLLLLLPVLTPLLRPGFFVSDDGRFHVYRIAALADAWREGVLHPRLFPEFGFGYGQAVLNYYSPLSYWPGALLSLLGMSPAVAFQWTVALGFVLAALAAYGYGRAFWGHRAGVAAALVYTYLPYHLADAYTRGALPEHFAFIFPPLILWAYSAYFLTQRRRGAEETRKEKSLTQRGKEEDSLTQRRRDAETQEERDLTQRGKEAKRQKRKDLAQRRRDAEAQRRTQLNPRESARSLRQAQDTAASSAFYPLLLGALAWAGLVLTHNLTTLLMALAAIPHLLLLAAVTRRWARLVGAGLSLLLAMGLSAGYWLPVLAESGAVGIGGGPSQGFVNHLIAPAELLVRSFVYPYRDASGLALVYPLSWLAPLLVLVGAVYLTQRGKEAKRQRGRSLTQRRRDAKAQGEEELTQRGKEAKAQEGKNLTQRRRGAEAQGEEELTQRGKEAKAQEGKNLTQRRRDAEAQGEEELTQRGKEAKAQEGKNLTQRRRDAETQEKKDLTQSRKVTKTQGGAEEENLTQRRRGAEAQRETLENPRESAQSLRQAQDTAASPAFYSLSVFHLALALGAVGMTTTLALSLWLPLTPLLGHLQYPWRFLVLAAVGLMGCAAVLPRLLPRLPGWLGAVGLTGLLVAVSLPGLPMTALELPAAQVWSPQRMWQEDAESGQVGATWTGEFLPTTVTEQRWALGRAREGAADGPPLSPAPAVRIDAVGHSRIQLAVESAIPFDLRLHRFAQPGWNATVDGAPVPVTATGEIGLATVAVEAGSRQVEFVYGPTTARRVGTRLALLAAALWTLLAWWGGWRRAALLLAAGALLLALNGAGVGQRTRTPLPVQARLGDAALLIGYETAPARGERALDVTLHWFALRETGANLSVFVHLLGADGGVIAQHDGQPVGGFTPTSRWRAGEIIADTHRIPLSPEIGPGVYGLKAGLYDPATVTNLPVHPPTPDNRVELGAVDVGR